MALSSFSWIICFVLLRVSSARKLSTEVNPECGALCEKEYTNGVPNVVYTKSEGEEDTLHHVWSTVGGNPSLLLLQAPSNESLNFTWSAQADGDIVPSISISGQPLYAFALVFNKIWEYQDTKDKGSMTDTMSNVVSIDLSRFVWQNVSNTLNATQQVTSALFQTKLNSSAELEENGLFSIQLETHADNGRSDVIPRFLYTSNSSQVCVVLDNFHSHFDESRFAIEVSVFVNEDVPNNVDIFKQQSVKSMDDEYTPGVFKNMHLISKNSQDNMTGSYVAWKPVAYTSVDLSVTGSTGAVYYDFVKCSVSNSSVAESFFKDHFHELEGLAFNVSFGTSQDGYYASTHYTKWTFSYGLGLPGEDALSSLVKIILASGLGLPLLLIILSCVYLAWHKFNTKKDDLSLSER